MSKQPMQERCSGTGIRTHFGDVLSPLAIRALLTHCTEKTTIPFHEIGWGRLARHLDDIVISNDHAVRTVFQGKLSASRYMRVPIPVPDGIMSGNVTIRLRSAMLLRLILIIRPAILVVASRSPSARTERSFKILPPFTQNRRASSAKSKVE